MQRRGICSLLPAHKVSLYGSVPEGDVCLMTDPRSRELPHPTPCRSHFWSSSSSPLLAPNPTLRCPSSLQPLPEIQVLCRPRPRPSWGHRSRWLQGLSWGRQNQFSRAKLGSGQGPSLLPPGGWADSRSSARHRPGAGPPPPPGPIPADRCQGAVCLLPGVNFLLKTIKLLRA